MSSRTFEFRSDQSGWDDRYEQIPSVYGFPLWKIRSIIRLVPSGFVENDSCAKYLVRIYGDCSQILEIGFGLDVFSRFSCLGFHALDFYWLCIRRLGISLGFAFFDAICPDADFRLDRGIDFWECRTDYR